MSQPQPACPQEAEQASPWMGKPLKALIPWQLCLWSFKWVSRAGPSVSKGLISSAPLWICILCPLHCSLYHLPLTTLFMPMAGHDPTYLICSRSRNPSYLDKLPKSEKSWDISSALPQPSSHCSPWLQQGCSVQGKPLTSH